MRLLQASGNDFLTGGAEKGGKSSLPSVGTVGVQLVI